MARAVLASGPMHRIPSSLLVLLLAFPLAACESVVVDPNAVSGTVVDPLGAPIVGARVEVGAAIVTTDAAGHFEAHALDGPYDMSIRAPDRAAAWLFLGLVDHEPTIRLFDGFSATSPDAKTATVTVSLPEKDDDSVVSKILLDVLDNVAEGVGGLDNPADPLEHTIQLWWAGQPQSKARFQAFRYTIDPVTKAPKHYIGYDTAEVVLENGVPATWAVSWKPPPFGEATISLTAHRSPGQGDLVTGLGILSEGAQFSQGLAGGATPGSEVSFVVPDLAGASFGVSVSAKDSSGASSFASVPGLAAGSKGGTVELRPSPVLISPKDGDQFGAGSEIHWSNQGNEASILRLRPADFQSHDPIYFVATDDESMVLPDLTQLGAQLPKGVKYTLTVGRDSWTPTVDDVAATPWNKSFATKPLSIATSAASVLISR